MTYYGDMQLPRTSAWA